jgi:hypothetical protein
MYPIVSEFVSKSVIDESYYLLGCSILGRDEIIPSVTGFEQRRCSADGIVFVQGYWNGLFLRSDRNNRSGNHETIHRSCRIRTQNVGTACRYHLPGSEIDKKIRGSPVKLFSWDPDGR